MATDPDKLTFGAESVETTCLQMAQLRSIVATNIASVKSMGFCHKNHRKKEKKSKDSSNKKRTELKF